MLNHVIRQSFIGAAGYDDLSSNRVVSGFCSSKNEQWLREVSNVDLMRFWRLLPVRRLRDRTLQTLLLVEAGTDRDHPQLSQIAVLFQEAVGIEDGNFTPKGEEIVDVLLREALVAPPARLGFANIRTLVCSHRKCSLAKRRATGSIHN